MTFGHTLEYTGKEIVYTLAFRGLVYDLTIDAVTADVTARTSRFGIVRYSSKLARQWV